MADYVWARDGHILGADRTAGSDANEVESLPSRAIQRYLDKGLISLKGAEVDTSALATDVELAAATGSIFISPAEFVTDTGTPTLGKNSYHGLLSWALSDGVSEGVSALVALPDAWTGWATTALFRSSDSTTGNAQVDVRAFEKNSLLETVQTTFVYPAQALTGAAVSAVTGPTRATKFANTKYLQVRIMRDGSMPADTLAADITFNGLLLTKV